MLDVLSKLEDRNDEVLYNYIEAIEETSIFKGSNAALTMFSMLNLALWRKDGDLFRAVITKMESSLLENVNFFKPIVNYIHYFCFYAMEKFDKVDTLKFYNSIVYFVWKFLAKNLKKYFADVYYGNDEYDGNRDAKVLNSIYYQVIDLAIGIISKTQS